MSETVFDAYLREHPGHDFAVLHLGQVLGFAHFVEPVFLIPAEYVERKSVGATLSMDTMMAGAWEVLEPMSKDGIGPALGAQILVAIGGNPHRAQASPRRHLRLVLDALDGFRGRGLPRHEGRGYVELGNALRSNDDYADALIAYQRGRALLESVGDDDGLRAAYARLAELTSRLGLPEQALLYVEAGQQVGTRPTGQQTDSGQAFVADILHSQRAFSFTDMGYFDDAESALAQWRRERSNGDSFDFLHALGHLRFRQARIAEGLSVYLRAIESRYVGFDHPLPVRTYHLEHNVNVFADAAGAALRLGRPELSIAVFASLAQSPPIGPEPEQSTPAFARLDQEIRDLARRATAATVAADQEALAEFDDRARILLDTRGTMLRESVRTPVRRQTIEELSQAIPASLRPGELALLYMHVSEQIEELYPGGAILVFAVHDGTVEYHALELPPDEIERLAVGALSECEQLAGTDDLRAVGEALLKPVAELVAGASRVYVSAQGVLQDYPFHAAPFRGRPLAASTEVRSLPSLAPLMRNRIDSAHDSMRAVVATVGQPRYELFPALPALQAEAVAVRQALPDAIILHDDAATAAAVRDAFATADVLHLAGHAAFERSHPQLARILLADRPLFAFEVACSPRVPRMVNLSGCRTAAELRRLGGSEGLAAAFLAVGAQSVIAPLWPVPDDAALAFNQALYTELARGGADFAHAAWQAQLSLMADDRFAHPGAWGAFRVLQRL